MRGRWPPFTKGLAWGARVLRRRSPAEPGHDGIGEALRTTSVMPGSLGCATNAIEGFIASAQSTETTDR